MRNVVDCFGTSAGKPFAPMIDPVQRLLANHSNLRFKTITTIGSRVKLPRRNFFDRCCRILALIEKATRKICGLPRNFLHVETLYWGLFFRGSYIKRVLCIEPSQSFLAVCKKNSIGVCEVQHGVVDISPTSLSHKHMTESDLYPDYFLSWDDESGKSAAHRSYGKSTPLSGCSLSLYHYWYHRGDQNQDYGKLVDPLDDRINVLVTLQWGMGPSGPDHYTELMLEDAYLPKEVLDFMAETRDKYNYIFRLHPMSKNLRREDEAIFDNLKKYGLADNKEELDRVSEVPIYEQFRYTDLHLTLYSSATIEASYVGVPTILLDPLLQSGRGRQDHFAAQIKGGTAFIVDIHDLEAGFKKAEAAIGRQNISVEQRFHACEQSLVSFLTAI